MSWILAAAVAFLLREVQAWNQTTDWASVKNTVHDLLNSKFPVFAQAGIDALADQVVDCFSLALKDTADLTKFANDLATGKLADALADAERLLAAVVHPSQPAVLAAVQELRKVA